MTTTLVDPLHELAYPLGPRPFGDALLVGARRAVRETGRAESVDLDEDGRLERPDEREVLLAMLRQHPALAVRRLLDLM